jgi:succinate--hydroxymethylglutarate CoA-transferase
MLFAMYSTGEPGRPPVKVGVAATDIATGLYAHGAIMAALISRQQTNKGVWIDCNLFESQVIIFLLWLSKKTFC